MGILRAKTGLSGIDLPTEDIWEYCCRAGGSHTNLRDLEQYALCSHYPNDKKQGKGPVDIGTFKPNRIGLYDMQGNVHEWCLDFVGGIVPAKIPFGGLGRYRMVKGGFYDSLPELCHPSLAFGQCSSIGDQTIGFRVCCY